MVAQYANCGSPSRYLRRNVTSHFFFVEASGKSKKEEERRITTPQPVARHNALDGPPRRRLPLRGAVEQLAAKAARSEPVQQDFAGARVASVRQAKYDATSRARPHVVERGKRLVGVGADGRKVVAVHVDGDTGGAVVEALAPERTEYGVLVSFEIPFARETGANQEGAERSRGATAA